MATSQRARPGAATRLSVIQSHVDVVAHRQPAKQQALDEAEDRLRRDHDAGDRQGAVRGPRAGRGEGG